MTRTGPSSVSSSLNIGIIGAGVVSTEAHVPILSSMENIDIKYVADIDEKQVNSLARPNRINGITIKNPSDIPDCDVALLATPVGAREDYIEVFGERGTPVFAEKPFATTRSQHEKFLEEIEWPFCNYMRTKFGATEQLQTLAAAELLGPIQSITISESYPGKSGGSRTYMTDTKLSGGGILMDHGVHTFSQLFHILPKATATVDKASIITVDDFDIDVKSTISLNNNNRVVDVDFHLSTVEPVPTQMTLEFENGTVYTQHPDPDSNIKFSSKLSGSTSLELASDETKAYSWKQAIYLMWVDFITKIQNGINYDKEICTGYRVTKLVEEIYNKAKTTERINP